ncbi:MAG: PaaI family thioesterase [Nitrososphaerales archaeon]|jgi:uncharacterized protein (TIGR00369 family)
MAGSTNQRGSHASRPPGGARLEAIRRAISGGGPVAPVSELIGFRLVEAGRGSAVVELEAGERHRNPMGTLHGGILCDIADAAMGMAYATELRPDETFTTVELKINFLRPFWSGRLRARGRTIRRGRTMGLMECRVTDERRRLVAYSTATCLALQGEAAHGLTRTRLEGATGGARRSPAPRSGR